MNTNPSLDLTQRLAGLETALAESRTELGLLRKELVSLRTSRRTTFAVLAGCVLLAAGSARLTVAASGGQTVAAPFSVVGDSGQPIMRLSSNGQLELYDKKGLPAVVLSPNGRAISVVGAGGKVRAQLAEGPNGSGDLTIFDKQGEVLADISEGAHQRGLDVYDKSGHPAVSLSAIERAHGISLFGDDGNVKALLAEGSTGTGSLTIFDKQGGILADIEEGENGGRGLFIYNRSKEPMVRILVTKSGDGQVTAGEKGKQTGFVAGPSGSIFQVLDPEGKRVLHVTDKSPSGFRGLWVYNSEDKLAATMHAEVDGNGAITALSKDGRPGVSLWFKDSIARASVGYNANGTPVFEANAGGMFIYNDKGDAVVKLESDDHGGKLTLANHAGLTNVEAGTLDNGRAVVRVYPLGGPTPIPIPWFIRGSSPPK